MGDPAGIGPELVAHVTSVFKDHADIDLVPVMVPFDGPLGRPTEVSGLAALKSIQESVKMALSGEVDAIVTAPISKTAMKLAGCQATDHTTLLKDLTGVTHTSMAFFSDPLKVVLATVHIPLADVPSRLTDQQLTLTLEHTQQFCRWMGMDQPRIAFAGLNPHAGEGGLMGAEELTHLQPFCAQKRASGVHLSDPLPPDTVFRQAHQGDFDVVIALYHDQGLIPVKLLAFDSAVNVTVGLPFIRTSPDHGTAYDIVGKNLADPSSMIAAIHQAHQFAQYHD